MATMMMNEASYRDGEDWGFLDHASVLTREDPPSSHEKEEGKRPGMNEARSNLETLRTLLLSSTPGGNTPGTLEPQQQLYQEEEEDGLDISQEISALIHFVDNFEFQTPYASQQRQPLIDRTNDHESTVVSKLLHEDLWDDNNKEAREQHTQEPDGRLLCTDRSDVELSPNHFDRLQQQSHPKDADWEKFQMLVRQVENALQDANEEREATRSWARQVREATKVWVQEQRDMMERERKTLHKNGSPSETIYKAKMERLENTIRGLELDLKTTELHHQTNEKRLHNIIQYQQENYHKLEKALGGRSATPWSNKQPPQEYVHSLQARTQELRDKTTPWAPTELQSQQQQQPPEPISSSKPQAEDSPTKRKISFTENAPITAKPMAKNSARTCWMTPPQPMNSNPTFHKPFGGITPGSVGLGKLTKTNSNKDSHKSLAPSKNIPGSKTKRIVTFANGAQKEIRDDSSSVVRFPNGDIQIFSSNKSVAYFHSKTQVIQVSTSDGSDIYEFPNRQVERHYPDGRKIVKFPDGSKKRIFSNGMVETFTSCGKYLVMQRPDGSRQVKTLR